MIRVVWLLSVVVLLAGAPVPTAGAEEQPAAQATPEDYVPVDLAKRSRVNGKTFMILAYAAALGLILSYAVSLYWRQKKIYRTVSEIEQKLPQKSSNT